MRRTTVERPTTHGAAHRATTCAAVGLVVAVGLVFAVAVAAFIVRPVSPSAPRFGESEQGQPGGTATEADGVLPGGVTVFDDSHPGVAHLDPDLLRALRAAATDAAADGIAVHVNSGWRAPAYQDQLLRQAVAEHGSDEEAARWVATVETSAHVSGDAVDIGSSAATAWLSEHGTEYGLCQIYANEPWHYERRPEAIDRGCPPLYADPTHDPRMQP